MVMITIMIGMLLNNNIDIIKLIYLFTSNINMEIDKYQSASV